MSCHGGNVEICNDAVTIEGVQAQKRKNKVNRMDYLASS